MSFETKIKKYARLAIAAGVKIQPGQLLVITADVDCAWYVRILVEEAYRSGAGEVVVNWNDSQIECLSPVARESTQGVDRSSLCFP